MNLSEFKEGLDSLCLSGSGKRQIRDLLTEIDDNLKLEGVASYVQFNVANINTIPFLASLIVCAGTNLNDNISLQLARHLRSISRLENSDLEISDLYDAVRISTGGNDDQIVQLFQKLILDCDRDEIQPDLLYIFPDMKLRHSELFLECIKRCACLDDGISLSNVVSLYICDLPPDMDVDAAKFIREAVSLFDDESWLKMISDKHLVEILAGLISLASILLNADLIRLTLSFLLRAFRDRTPSSVIVRVLATPYIMWMHEAADLIPELDQIYEEELGSVDSATLIEQSCKELNNLVFVNQKHMKMKIKPKILEKQKWRAYRRKRLG